MTDGLRRVRTAWRPDRRSSFKAGGKLELQHRHAAERVVVVGGNLAKAERAIEVLGGRHALGKRVEPHLSVPDLPRRMDDGLGEPTADPGAGKAGFHP